jgi:hypothetical protein
MSFPPPTVVIFSEFCAKHAFFFKKICFCLEAVKLTQYCLRKKKFQNIFLDFRK